MTRDYVEDAHKLVEEIEAAEVEAKPCGLRRYLLAIIYGQIGVAQELAVVSMWLRELLDR